MLLNHKTVLFQGDSITDMNRGRGTDPNHLYGHSYVFLLAAKFGCKSPEKCITVHNRGVSGDRSIDVYERRQRDIFALRPDIVSLLVGINDILFEASGENGVTAGRYAEILCRLIEETADKLPGTEFVLCEPFVHPDSLREDYRAVFARLVPQHQEAARRVAERCGCLFVPLQSVFDAAYERFPQGGAAYWIWDGIHPTAAGQQLIADQWLSCVEEGN